MLDHAAQLYKSAPDSSLALLDEMPIPDALTDELLSRWCILYGQAADTLDGEMPYTFQLTRALAYSQKRGTKGEQAQLGYYLGRSYAEDKEYEKALEAYLPALDIAWQEDDDNLSGSLCYHIGDLYFLKEMLLPAAAKYKEAAVHFRRAGNHKGYAFALRDESECYYKSDLITAALACLREADKAIATLDNPAEQSYIYYIIGNAYAKLDSMALAEKYQWMSVRLDSIDTALSYLALAEIYRRKGDLPQARHFIREAQARPSEEKDIPAMALYLSYQIEKEARNTEAALQYVEQYIAWKDSAYAERSRMHILDIEKKYNHQKEYLENMELKIGRQRMFIWLGVLMVVCLLLLLVYQWMVRFKNAEINKQREALAQKDIRLLTLSLDLKERKTELEQLSRRLSGQADQAAAHEEHEQQAAEYEEKKKAMDTLVGELLQLKKEKLLLSPIAGKVLKLSAQVTPGSGKSLLTEKDWKQIQDTVDEIYYPIASSLLLKDVRLTAAEERYCYLAFFCLSTSAEAILLSLAPESVTKGHQRLRQKLGITGGKAELYAYLTNL